MAMADGAGSEAHDDEAVAMSLDQALLMAVGWHREGRYEDAANIYRQILQAVPDHVDALHFLGVAEHQAGRTGPALAYLDRAIALAPDHPDARCNRGNVHRLLGNFEAAEVDYRHALDGRPDDPNTQSNLATLLRARGDWEGAVAALRAVVAKHPEHGTAWLNLANTLQGMDRSTEALRAYEQVSKLAPESAMMFRDMGIALYTEGRLQEAIAMYRRCLSLAPDDARARHLLAACTGEDVPSRAADAYVRDEFDTFAASFDARLARLEYRGPEIVVGSAREVVAEMSVAPDVLDAGCGTGLCAPLLRPLAGRLVGVDLSPEMIAMARKRGGYDELVVGELTSFLRGHPQCFDLVVSADTLVYFGALDEVFGAVAGALRPQGVLVCTLECSEPEHAVEGFGLQPHGRYAHTQGYVMDSARRAGLRDLTIHRTQTRKEAQRWVDGWLFRARAS
jgi:predicted TPR repeat methyltransferase